jgi:5-methylcytosine-specific restriction endonuclease McrA
MKGKPGKFRFLPLEERLKAHTTHRIKVRSWSGRHAKSVNHSVGERGHRDKGRVNWEMLEVSWKATEGKCWSCFAPLTLEPCKVHTVQWDHLLPLSRGGRNEQKNILPACRPCNAFKSDLTAEEFKLVITGQFVPLFGILRARHCQD